MSPAAIFILIAETVAGTSPLKKCDTRQQNKITGHTNSNGTPANNMELSKKSAAAVKAYLVMNYSIDVSRIHTNGKGASIPVSNNSSADGKAKNRMVKFVKL